MTSPTRSDAMIDIGHQLPGGEVFVRQRQHEPAPQGLRPPPPVLMLHGISSGAASWDAVAAALPPQRRLLAWDAPGYGHSAALHLDLPGADDYAAIAQQLLDALGVQRVCLVGHSLGALIATALAARLGPQRVSGLLLLSPARGYGGGTDGGAEAARVRQQRLDALQRQGIAGLAASVSQRLLSAAATPEQHARVQAVAQRLTPGGYTQAVQLLCSSRLLDGAPALAGIPVQVAVGADDIVTPPAACAGLAAALGVALHTVPAAGHALPVEQPEAVAALINAWPDASHHASPDAATTARPNLQP